MSLETREGKKGGRKVKESEGLGYKKERRKEQKRKVGQS